MKAKKSNLVERIILAFGALVGSAYASQGGLEIAYDMNDLSYDNHDCKSFHVAGTTEEPNDPTWDVGYGNRLFSPNQRGSKIISKFDSNDDPNELTIDSRPLDSNTPISLELSIHTQSGGSVNFSNHESELKFSFPWEDWKFDGGEPITYWEPNDTDPNTYHLVANVRKEILQGAEGVGVIPLPILNGTYESEEVHFRPGVRYDVYPIDLNGDTRANLYEYAVWANAYGRTGITDVNRADVNDPGAWADFNLDDQVDFTDLDFMNDVWVYTNEITKWK